MGTTRRNILSLTLDEVKKVTAAFNKLKSNGTYDAVVRRHMTAMNTATPPGASSNAAHRGPLFLPWHRAALLEMENALRLVDSTIVGLPYWAWENEAALNGGEPRSSRLWTADYLGTDGDSSQDDRVLNGPFANWNAVIYDNSTTSFANRTSSGLIRRLGRDPAGSGTLADSTQVDDALANYRSYDSSPWDATTATFRNRIEGWSSGPRLHNQVHLWVGGDMLAGTSPNDPVFWLNHCNVDRHWWTWQKKYGVKTYRPTSGGPSGLNANDTMSFLDNPRTPASVLDIGKLGYTYA